MRQSLQVPTLLICGLLSACATNSQDSNGKNHGSCNADAVQHLLEQRITPDLAEQARKKAGATYLRVTQPNQPVTLEYNEQRLNIEIDDADSIIRLNCG